jgi:two-component system, NtrC family, sensor kinase
MGGHMVDKEYNVLKWKIIAAILSFSLIPLIVVGWFIYSQFSTSYQAKINENILSMVESRRKSLDLFFEERVTQLATLAHSHQFSSLINEDFLLGIFNTMQARSKSYIDLGVIDQNGDHVAYVGPHKDLRGLNYKNEDWFAATMSSGSYISDVFMGFRSVPHMIIAVMVREKDMTWILRATINLDIIERVVRSAQTGQYGDAFIINRQNILQTNPRFVGSVLEKPAGPCPDFSKTISTRVEKTKCGNENYIFASAVVNSSNWVLVVMESPQEQLSALLRAREKAEVLLILGVLIIFGGTYMVARAFMGKLVRMAKEKALSDEMCFQSNKMAALGKMAAGLAHEVNNPLAVIGEKAGWVKDLLKKEGMPEGPHIREIADSINKIEYHVDRARKVTHRLLGFARRMEPVMEQVDINKLVNDTVSFFSNDALFRNIKIITELDSNMPLVTTDSSQLQQVFLNIINNSVDAVDRDGWIRISATADRISNKVAIAFEDNGPGIEQENLSQIFDPFFTTKEPGKGTGLGLSISYQIVEYLGGKIDVESRRGEGTKFTVSLPLRVAQLDTIG